ncbi:MAG: hypothetical protein GY696_36425 [Gammaproteobacteria bacterium]|nr:hypothetical protein [Gammaproteobacteria bacterium]
MYHQINRLSGYRPGRQSGVALVVSLVLLLIITMLSISAMRSTNIDTKISINHQFKQVSFQAAESALARLLGPAPGVALPATTPQETADNDDYFTSTGVAGQPDISADLTIEFIEQTPPGKYKFSGYGLDMVTFLYQADATGEIDSSNTQTHNRMQVARVRQ